MLYIPLYFAEIFTLYFLSRKVIKLLFIFFYKLTHNKNLTVWIFSILFLPGTIIHELSHFLMAVALFVPVGKFEIFPEIIDEGIKLGSVAIAKTDPIRRLFIGAAPFIFGNLIIFFTLYIPTQNNLLENWLYYLIIGYIVFQIGNTMFSSKKDLEGAWKALVIFAAIFTSLFILRININWSFATSVNFINIIQKACLFLGLPIVIDTLIIIMFSQFKWPLKK